MEEPASVSDVYRRAGFGRRLARGTRPVIVVPDFSNGFTDPTQLTGAEMTEAVCATAAMLEQARAAAVPVVFSTIAYDPGQLEMLAWPRKVPGLAALTVGSPLVELDTRLGVRAEEHVVVKVGASAFFGTALATYLVSVGADTVVVAGATTSGCVRATVVDALQYGYPVLVPRACVADRAVGRHEANLFDMQQKYADVLEQEDVLRYLAALPSSAGTGTGPGAGPVSATSTQPPT